MSERYGQRLELIHVSSDVIHSPHTNTRHATFIQADSYSVQYNKGGLEKKEGNYIGPNKR